MNREDWYRARNDRSIRYAKRVLDDEKWVCIQADPAYAKTYAGQVAVLTAANLLGRMTPSVSIDVPKVKVVSPLPWAGAELSSIALGLLRDCDPFTRAELRAAKDEDYCLHLGSGLCGETVHGVGWNAYVGPAPSPLSDSNNINPIGPALSVVIAVGQLFKSKLGPLGEAIAINALNWSDKNIEQSSDLEIDPAADLGNIWVAGVGSVGTAALYFLTLISREFSAHLFDHDCVKIHNLDRSPIFRHQDVGQRKANSVATYLRSVGLRAVVECPTDLGNAPQWLHRQAGTPDLLISAANEFNVRYQIEAGLPPLQIYATTGEHWNTTLLRHIPLVDACSRCAFPNDPVSAAFTCATGEAVNSEGEKVDAALPFLSFSAGIMVAAEVLKLSLKRTTPSYNRASFYMLETPQIFTSEAAIKSRCICQIRSSSAHRAMIASSKYAGLTNP